MAITKRFKVSFDVTFVVDSETEQLMNQQLLKLAKRFTQGDEISHIEFEILKQSLTNGPDGVAETTVRKSIRDSIKGMTDGESDFCKFSPATVRTIR